MVLRQRQFNEHQPQAPVQRGDGDGQSLQGGMVPPPMAPGGHACFPLGTKPSAGPWPLPGHPVSPGNRSIEELCFLQNGRAVGGFVWIFFSRNKRFSSTQCVEHTSRWALGRR